MDKAIRFAVIDAMDAAVREGRAFTGIQFFYHFDGRGSLSLRRAYWPL